jgi:hypothetical protein
VSLPNHARGPAVVADRPEPRLDGCPASVGLMLRGACVAAAICWWGLSASPADAQTVQGRVLDARSGEPVPAAAVELLWDRNHVQARVSTDAEGRFRLHTPSAGTYQIRAGRIGFQTVTTPSFDLLRNEDPFEVEVLLDVEAISLAPLVVISERPARVEHLRLHTRGFYDRERTWGREGMGFGQFLGPEDLERKVLMRASDALRDLRGVRVEGAGRRSIRVAMRGGCSPDLFVDGVRIRGGVLDELVAASEVLAVEVYVGGTRPVEFITSMGSSCGAVAIWTGAR